MAENIAAQWRNALSQSDGKVRDFVCVGDVDIKVIGADNQILDIQVPARQMAEQIVAKLGIPPFLLGLQWSTTERMSAQQADILTSRAGLLPDALKRRHPQDCPASGFCPGASGRSRRSPGRKSTSRTRWKPPGAGSMTPRRKI